MTHGTGFGRVIGLGGAALDRLMPMHLWVGPTGHVLRAGPTLRKLVARPMDPPPIFTDWLSFDWPRSVGGLADLLLLDGATLTVSIRDTPGIALRGHVVSLPAGGGGLINLSLGGSLPEAVGRHGLTLTDFAPTELTSELLFLIEVNAMVRAASRDLTDRLQETRAAAERQALTDPLTGLLNRRAMDRVLGNLTASGQERGQDRGADHGTGRFGLMRLDLDHFKAVNDRLGHASGDLVLQKVARILCDETREQDMVARVGGDEFVLILRDCDDLAILNRIAARILERLEQPILIDGQVARVSASIGTTLSSFYDPPQPDRMLSDADDATYRSKDAGRARHTVHCPALCAAAPRTLTPPARSSPARH